MISLTFPDGRKQEYNKGITGYEIADSISKSLVKKAVLIEINGELKDLRFPVNHDADIRILMRQDKEVLQVIRHDAAHVMAQAVQELFPGTQVTIGPAIEDGFYYDFASQTPFSTEDLEKIEQRMHEIIQKNEPFIREVWDREKAIQTFTEMGEQYKAELIRDLPEEEIITIYKQGDWFDLCRGPHLPSTGKIGSAIKLMKVAGAYWRGDAKNAQLQRIYGTAWKTKQELDDYLFRLAEAERRDHRKLGQSMDLFHVQEEAKGMIFWHRKGWSIWLALESYMRRRLEQAGYIEVKTPLLIDRHLWEESGHWDKFSEHMYTIQSEDEIQAIKPMNCPAHVQIFKQGQKSYRDLPLRMAEFGACHRNEPSGALHGLMRVRGFTQDDAHIFCTQDQITEETKKFIDLLKLVYSDLGFDEVKIRFSDRPEIRAGSDEVWDQAEAALKKAMDATGLEMELNPGDGAFYGPKLEFILKDAVGREWQCGTHQLDFVLPERLNASYTGEDGQKHRPVMLHRAILGSMERFIGILIEHYEGKFPLWLAPVQNVIATVTSDVNEDAMMLKEQFQNAGLRVELDCRNEKISYKIREHSHAKIPVIAILGKKEAENHTITLRRLGAQAVQQTCSVEQAISLLVNEAKPPDLD